MPKMWLGFAACVALLLACVRLCRRYRNVSRARRSPTIVATFGRAGVTTTYGRLIARYLAEISHRLARAGEECFPAPAISSAPTRSNAAKPDGLTIGMFNTGLLYDQLLHRDGGAVRSDQIQAGLERRHPRDVRC